MKRFAPFLLILLSILACRTGDSEQRDKVFSALYPSPTSDATQTPIIQTVIATKVVQITTTPIPIVPTFTNTPAKPVRQLCVSATETVYLRPSPSIENYPITQLENGVKVTDLGGRNGAWWFVEWKDKRGWINSKYLKECQ